MFMPTDLQGQRKTHVAHVSMPGSHIVTLRLHAYDEESGEYMHRVYIDTSSLSVVIQGHEHN